MTKKKLPRLDFGEIDDQQATAILYDVQNQAVPSARVLLDVPVSLIDPSPYQARKHFNPASVEQLAESMRTDGFLSVLRVRKHPLQPGRFQLVYGERRWRAAQLVVSGPTPRFSSIPCEVVEASDEQMARIGLLENMQREDLLPEEEAQGMQELLTITMQTGERAYSIRKLAVLLKKDESYIQDRLYLLELPEDVKNLYRRYPGIALRGLREVCTLEDSLVRAPVIERIILEQMSFARIRVLVQEVREALYARSSEPIQVESPTAPVSAREQTQNKPAPPLKQEGSEPHIPRSHAVQQKEPSLVSARSTVAQEIPIPSQGKQRISYAALLRRDEKLVLSLFEGWQKLLEEADSEVQQQVRSLLQQVQERSASLLVKD